MMDYTLNTILTIGGVCGGLMSIIGLLKVVRTFSKPKVKKYILNSISPDLKDIKDSISELSNTIAFIKEESDKGRMQQIRYECLCFASDLRKGIPKTRQEYEEVFRMEATYDEFVKRYKIKNGYMEEEMQYIHNQYKSLKEI